MTAPIRSDPLLFLPGEQCTHDPSEEYVNQASPQYTPKPIPAPPYSPPTTGPAPEGSNSSSTVSPAIGRSLSPPPNYNAFDALARDFQLRGHFVYASTTNTPHYQIKTTLTTTGRPHQLHLRRLLPTEMRRAHRASASTATPPPPLPSAQPLRRAATAPTHPTPLQPPTATPTIPYDDDTTAYTATLHPTAALEIRGRRASSLRGHITIAPSPFPFPSFSPLPSSPPSSSLPSKSTFHHHTRNPAFDALDPAHEQRIQRHGYHARDEWVRRVLFVARAEGRWGRRRRRSRGSDRWGKGREVVWEDEAGRVCAVETEEVVGGGEEDEEEEKMAVRGLRLEAGTKAVTERGARDVLVMCWVVRLWGVVLGDG